MKKNKFTKLTKETIVNAIAHRDYTISGTDIELSIYSDRLEAISPGRLPNTVTIERDEGGCVEELMPRIRAVVELCLEEEVGIGALVSLRIHLS